MRDPDPYDSSKDLDQDVSRRNPGRNFAAKREDQRNGRIKMRPRNGTENRDQYGQSGPGCQRIPKKGYRRIASRKALAHHAGAANNGEQQRRAECFRRKAPSEVEWLDRRL